MTTALVAQRPASIATTVAHYVCCDDDTAALCGALAVGEFDPPSTDPACLPCHDLAAHTLACPLHGTCQMAPS